MKKTARKTARKSMKNKKMNIPNKIKKHKTPEQRGGNPKIFSISSKYSVLSVSFSPNGGRIVFGSTDKIIRVLKNEVDGLKIINTLNGHTGYVNSVSFSPDGTRIVSGSNDNTVRVWNSLNGTQISSFTGHTGYVNSVSFSPDGTRIVSGSNDKTVRVWNSLTGIQIQKFINDSGVRTVSFSPDGKRIVSDSNDEIKIWEADSTKWESVGLLETISGNTQMSPGGAIHSVSFNHDGTQIVSAGGFGDNNVRTWNVNPPYNPITFREDKNDVYSKSHSKVVNSVSFNHDGTQIVSGSNDKTIKIWNAESKNLLYTLRGHTGNVESVSFNRNGTQIVSGSDDGTVRVWDTVEETEE